MLVDLAAKYKVETFVYSSGMRAGPSTDGSQPLSHAANPQVEEYCKRHSDGTLPWTYVWPEHSRSARACPLADKNLYSRRIIRPAFFLENFQHMVGAVTVGVLKKALHADTKLGVIVCRGNWRSVRPG